MKCEWLYQNKASYFYGCNRPFLLMTSVGGHGSLKEVKSQLSGVILIAVAAVSIALLVNPFSCAHWGQKIVDGLSCEFRILYSHEHVSTNKPQKVGAFYLFSDPIRWKGLVPVKVVWPNFEIMVSLCAPQGGPWLGEVISCCYTRYSNIPTFQFCPKLYSPTE